MANSNVRSSAYKAAGSWNTWGKVSTGNNHIVMDAPKPDHIIEFIKDTQDKNDAYHLLKAELRDTLKQGYDESLVTVVAEGKRGAKKTSKKVLTQRKKRETVAPSKRLNRKEKRELKK